MVAVSVLIINGYFLNFYVTARLTTFNFSQKYARSESAWKVRKLSMIFGAISAVSWYSALIFAEFKDYFHISFFVYFGIYLLALALAIAASLGMEIILYRRGIIAVNQPKEPTIEQLSYSPLPKPPLHAINPSLPALPTSGSKPADSIKPQPDAPINPQNNTPN